MPRLVVGLDSSTSTFGLEKRPLTSIPWSGRLCVLKLSLQWQPSSLASQRTLTSLSDNPRRSLVRHFLQPSFVTGVFSNHVSAKLPQAVPFPSLQGHHLSQVRQLRSVPGFARIRPSSQHSLKFIVPAPAPSPKVLPSETKSGPVSCRRPRHSLHL